MEKPVEIVASTRYIRVFREDGSMLSQHLTIEDAIESAVNAGGGNYQVVYPERVVRVSKAYGILSPGADTVPPTQPQGLSGYATGPTSIQLSWSPSTDNVGVIGYQVYKNGVPLPATETVSMLVSGLSPGTQYQFSVSAFDAAGNSSLISTSILVTTEANSPPVWSNPGTQGLTIGVPYSLSLTGYVTDADAVTISMSSGILPNGVGFNPGTGIVSGIPTTAQTVTATFTASDGVFTPVSQPIQFEVLNADTTAPSQPQNLIGEGTGGERIELTWNASTDPTVAGARTSGVSGYKLYRDGLLRDSIGIATSYSDTQVAAGIEYSYTVSAVDHANNESAQSTAAVASTGAFGWTIPDAPYVTSGPWYSQTAGQVYGVAQHANLAGVTPVYSITSQKKASVTGDYGFTIDASTGVLSVPSTLAEPVAPATTDSYTVSVDLQSLVTSTDLTTLTLTGSGAWTFGQAFKQGDIPTGWYPTTDETQTQADVRNRWPDGSVKFAVLSGIGGNRAVKVQKTQAAPSGTNIATSALSAVTARFDAGASSVTFSGADWSSPQRVLCLGPVMSSWVYRKAISSTLSAWLEVRAYVNGNVEVFPWVESTPMFTAVAATGSILWKFTLNGTERFSASFDLKHHTRIPLVTGSTFSYWTGSDPAITPAHDGAYLRATKLVPNMSKAVPTTARLNAFQQTYTPNTLAGVSSSMGDAGTSSSLLNVTGIAYLASGDVRAYRASVVFGLSSGSWSCHWRDEANLSDGDGHFRCSRYPNLSMGWGGTPTVPGGSGGANGTIAYTHLPSYGYFAYLLTGRYWFFEESAFWLAHGNMDNQDQRRFYADGVMDTSAGYANRGAAWAIRNLGEVATFAPEAGNGRVEHPLRTEWLGYVANNARFYRTKYVDGGTYTEAGRSQSYSQVFGTSWVSPQGILGEYSSSGGSLYATGTSGGIWMGAAWMQGFSVAAWGQLSNWAPSSVASANIQAVRDHAYKQPIARGGAQGYDWRRFIVYGYPIGTDDTGLPPEAWDTPAQSYAHYLTAHALSDATLAANTLKTHGSDTNLSAGTPSAVFYGSIETSGLAMAVEHGASGAAAAWANITGAANWSAMNDAHVDCSEYGVYPR